MRMRTIIYCLLFYFTAEADSGKENALEDLDYSNGIRY